jgi:hypothetical protein
MCHEKSDLFELHVLGREASSTVLVPAFRLALLLVVADVLQIRRFFPSLRSPVADPPTSVEFESSEYLETPYSVPHYVEDFRLPRGLPWLSDRLLLFSFDDLPPAPIVTLLTTGTTFCLALGTSIWGCCSGSW